MNFRSTLITALLSGSIAFAASNSTSTNNTVPSSCSIGSKATATSQADLDKYSSCKTLVGNLTVTGDLGSAALANVEQLNGSLTLNNATNLVSFSADNLKTITGSLTMRDLTILTTASFGSLEEVDTINMITLPAISDFATNLQNANNILVSDTTLETVDGFSTLKKVSVLNINNNRYLTSFNSDLKFVSDALDFSFNGNQAAVSFDNLVWAKNITLRDVQAASFKSLQSVNASLAFINNSISNLTLSKLATVGQTFSISSNEDLTSLHCSNLTTIGGGFVVANNTKLRVIDGFKSVATVGGAVVITGNFTELDLPKLKSVRGDATFETTSGNFSCSPFKDLQKKGAIQGDSFVCKNGAKSSSSVVSSVTSSGKKSSTISTTSTGSSSKSTSSTKSSSSSSKSKGAAAQNIVAFNSFFGIFSTIITAVLL